MIYLLEDDRSIRELIVYTLHAQGYEIEGFERPSLFREACGRRKPDLAILDIMLPEESGIEVLKWLREDVGTDIMVLMLTAKSTEYDKVVGLDAGADDYLAKPFGMMELIARVKALLRRSGGHQEAGEELVIGRIRLNARQHKVYVDDREEELTLKEFGLLELLMTHRGTVLTRQQLIDKIWGYDFFGDTRTVDVHIRTLRQKLGDGAEIIKTVHGLGYKVE